MKRTPVSNISIERTAYGYVLRRSSRFLRMSLLMAVIPLSLLFLLVFLMEPEERRIFLIGVSCCIGFQLLLLLPLILLSKGQRLELDREGIHLCFDIRKGKTLYWTDVRDWGFGYVITKSGKNYFLYFSPTKLAPLGTDNKKAFGVKGLLSFQIAKQDYVELSRSGLLNFCRGHLGDEDGMTDRYVPLFRSDIAEGLYED